MLSTETVRRLARARLKRDHVEELVLAYVAALYAVDHANSMRDRAQAAADQAQTDADARRAELIAMNTPRPRRLVAGDRLVTVSQDDVTVEAVEPV